MGESSKNRKSSVSLVISTLKMAAATGLSRVLGLIREQVMAAYFGASGLTDAYLIAYRIPNLFRDLLAEGAFSSAFVPSFVEEKAESLEKARELLCQLFFQMLILTGMLSLLICFFAEPIMDLFVAEDFKQDITKFSQAVALTRIMGPYLMLASIAALFMGALNSLKVFFIPSLAPALFNVSLISSMVFLSPWLNEQGVHPIFSLGFGVVAGGVGQCLLQFPYLIKYGVSLRLPKNFFSPKSKRVFQKLGPGLLGFAATQINLLINSILATGAGIGAVSWLNYSFRLFQLPVGLLSVSVGNSHLVHFSEKVKSNDHEGAKSILKSTFFLSLVTTVPAMIVLISLREPIVRLIYERGEFLSSDSINTSAALMAYGIGLPFYGLYKILVPSFYALEKPRIPVFCSLLSILSNIVFCLSTVDEYGYIVLAYGTSLSMILNCSLQSILLKRDMKLPLSFFVNKDNLRILLVGIMVFALDIWLTAMFQHSVTDSVILSLCKIGLEIFGIFGSFVLLLAAFGERRPLMIFVNILKRKSREIQ